MATTGRPNILFLIPDQHRWDFMETTLGLPVRMPNLEELAARGIRFNQAIVNSPLCAPSRASLASTRNYHRTGVEDNFQDYPLDLPTFYQALRTAGYRTGGVGKFDLHKKTSDWGPDGKRCLDEWGFSDGVDNEGKWDMVWNCADEPKGPYSGYLHGRDLMAAHVADMATRAPGTDEHRNYGQTAPSPLPEEAYSDNWLTEHGLDIINGFPTDTPWFLQVNFTGPHEPNDVTARMHARWQGVEFPEAHRNTQHNRDFHNRVRQNYSAILENIDRQIGRLLEAVAARGELDNTIVVYSSDHGEMLGDNDLWAKTHPNQGSIAVPLVVAGPGVQKGVKSDALVALIDLAGTFVDYGEATLPPGSDALSLRPTLEGTATTHREHVFSGMTREGTTLDWDLVWDGRYKLVIHRQADDELFDLDNDPFENDNIIDSAPDVAARLRELLEIELARSD
ncbi:MAG TPA: sulfatase-like hydrolase/transferase [Chloroflexota bacterium]|nr:sulfatase-like hydrolase/transferase [Chloroflexota bacterium]